MPWARERDPGGRACRDPSDPRGKVSTSSTNDARARATGTRGRGGTSGVADGASRGLAAAGAHPTQPTRRTVRTTRRPSEGGCPGRHGPGGVSTSSTNGSPARPGAGSRQARPTGHQHGHRGAGSRQARPTGHRHGPGQGHDTHVQGLDKLEQRERCAQALARSKRTITLLNAGWLLPEATLPSGTRTLVSG